MSMVERFSTWGQIYDFAEMAKINAGEVPKPANEVIEVIGSENFRQ